ncbi:protein unc-45 homolog B-like [Dysidea avara]|uniref:protein unc-45 homolog B-like n=1 Tax=Dysidea avara TaxID=196820 RepID=UPI003321CF9C
MSDSRSSEEKAKGNACFKKGDYNEAATFYANALKTCSADDKDMIVALHKNRAACWLKLQRYEDALSDCKTALQLAPSDVKALYRLAQAFEGKKEYSEAMRTLKYLLTIEPKNKEAIDFAQKVTTFIKQQMEKSQSTDYLVGEMFEALENTDTPVDKKIQAAKNFAILSRENAGAERIIRSDGAQKMVSFLDFDNVEVVTHILNVFIGLCTYNRHRTLIVTNVFPVSKMATLLSSETSDVSTTIAHLLQRIFLAFAFSSDETTEEYEITGSQLSILVSILEMLLALMVSYKVGAVGRDAILELFMALTRSKRLCKVFVNQELPKVLIRVAANTSDINEPSIPLPMSNRSRMNVSVVLTKLHEGLKKEEKKQFEQQCSVCVMSLLSKDDETSQIQGMTSLAAILQGVVQVGNAIFSEDVILAKVVTLAGSDNPRCQIIAVELLALSASDKDHCKKIMEPGVPMMKKLFTSNDDRIKIRALVGLCKLGSVGGWNINARTFSTEELLKLQDACRKFLVSPEKDLSLQKWAIEGIAFLSMDAEVKEVFIKDLPTLKVFFTDVVVEGTTDQSLLYGVATILVNLTNSYDKPERNPQLEELGKYAGENLPKEHEFDEEKYVKNRVAVLLQEGAVPALVTVGACDSLKTREQTARVLLALSNEQANRGVVVQQGGAKCLLSLALKSTKEGKLAAAQALAKIGITTNPELAFPGQRSLEVIRPLVALLRSEKGLQQFEGLMALTNLAGMNNDVRRRILKEGGVREVESLMFEEHEMIRRAATETMCNLIQLEDVAKRFLDDDVERVKLLTLFAGEDDELLARAAAGALAQLTRSSPICQKMMAVKSCMEILKQICLSENIDLRHRGVYILGNLVDADKEIAEKLLDNSELEVMVILNGLSLDKSHKDVKECADRALKKLVEYKLIEPFNPEAKAT